MGEGALRALVPRVLVALVRRGEDFDAAEDALQEALLEALRVWPEHPPRDPRAWLTSVATRRLVDARRSEAARRRREETDLAGEAIRLARQLTLATDEPEARGLLALMLLNHARLPARPDAQGRIVTLDRQDRSRWDRPAIAEGVRVLQSALAASREYGRPGQYQVQAAIAALHDDAASAAETDWPQILAWYDDLVALSDDPVRQDPAAVLGRAVAVGRVRGAAAGLRETDRLRDVLGERHRWHAVRGHLHELDGDRPAAATAYAAAACRATEVAERDHLVRQAARARATR